MTADKIKEIEQKYDMWAVDYNLTPQDIEWLIEQAKLNKGYRRQIGDMNKKISKQRKQIKGADRKIIKLVRTINFIKYGDPDRTMWK